MGRVPGARKVDACCYPLQIRGLAPERKDTRERRGTAVKFRLLHEGDAFNVMPPRLQAGPDGIEAARSAARQRRDERGKDRK